MQPNPWWFALLFLICFDQTFSYSADGVTCTCYNGEGYEIFWRDCHDGDSFSFLEFLKTDYSPSCKLLTILYLSSEIQKIVDTDSANNVSCDAWQGVSSCDGCRCTVDVLDNILRLERTQDKLHILKEDVFFKDTDADYEIQVRCSERDNSTTYKEILSKWLNVKISNTVSSKTVNNSTVENRYPDQTLLSQSFLSDPDSAVAVTVVWSLGLLLAIVAIVFRSIRRLCKGRQTEVHHVEDINRDERRSAEEHV